MINFDEYTNENKTKHGGKKLWRKYLQQKSQIVINTLVRILTTEITW